jgi:hypothetical protein
MDKFEILSITECYTHRQNPLDTTRSTRLGYQDIIIYVYATHVLIIYFIFSDVIATCFDPLSGHHQAILTQMYHETSFYNGSIVSIGIKKILVVYNILFNLENYKVIILPIIFKTGVKNWN